MTTHVRKKLIRYKIGLLRRISMKELMTMVRKKLVMYGGEVVCNDNK